MKHIVAVLVVLGVLWPATVHAQCTAPGCEEATAVVSAARATARAVLTREAPTVAPTQTPAPTATTQPTATATATTQPTNTATMEPTQTQLAATATTALATTATMAVSATPATAQVTREPDAPPIYFVFGAFVLLLFAILFIWIAVKAVINAKFNR